MSRREELPRGAWLIGVETSQAAWSPEVRSASEALDHETATIGAITVLLGGLLHNRTALIQLLGTDGEGNDASLVLQAYERWGAGAIERLLGTCSTIVCDADRRIILAARDRLGTYPLFRAEVGSRMLLSNSIDALLTQDGVSHGINLPVVVDHLRHVWPFAEETYFEGVWRIPPGNVLRRDTSGTRVNRYWDPASEGHVEWVRPDEIDEFDVLFEQAVARCQSVGQIGIFLSGGLDSVSVAAVATTTARLTGAPDPIALSLAFPGAASEEDIQRGVAEGLGIQQVMLDWGTAVGRRGLLQELLERSAEAPAPLLNLWMPAYDRLAAAGRELGCVSILTGGGGDEWLIVSPYYAADLIRTLDLRGLLRLYNEHRRSHNVSPLPYVRHILWRFGLRPLALDSTVAVLRRRAPSLLATATRRRMERKVPEWLAPDPVLRKQMAERELQRRDEQWSKARAAAEAGRQYPRIYFSEVRSGLEHPLVSMEFEEIYEQGRHLDMRILQPFWDSELVEFLYRTPPELLNAGGRSKALVRNAVAQRFPGLGFERQRKITAAGVVESMVQVEGKRIWSELGLVGCLGDMGLVDAPGLRRYVDDILGKRETRKYYAIWYLLTLESFLRKRQEG